MKTKYIDELAQTLVSLENKKVAIAFLKNILTPSELEEIATRLQIAKLLNEGVAQRDVAKKLNVSIGTVSRGSRELKYGESGFKQVLNHK